MQWIFWVFALFVLCFGFVVWFGAPYVPTLDKQAKVALDMVDLKPGETLLELGSGDGKILLAAAKRGWKAVGYEMNPILVLVSRWRTRRYRKQVRVVWGNFWRTPWPPAEGVFVFLLPKYMQKLDSAVEAWHSKPIKLVSFAFPITAKQPAGQKDGVYLYEYR